MVPLIPRASPTTTSSRARSRTATCRYIDLHLSASRLLSTCRESPCLIFAGSLGAGAGAASEAARGTVGGTNKARCGDLKGQVLPARAPCPGSLWTRAHSATCRFVTCLHCLVHHNLFHCLVHHNLLALPGACRLATRCRPRWPGRWAGSCSRRWPLGRGRRGGAGQGRRAEALTRTEEATAGRRQRRTEGTCGMVHCAAATRCDNRGAEV